MRRSAQRLSRRWCSSGSRPYPWWRSRGGARWGTRMPDSIACEGVSVRYGEVRALDEATLTVEAGEVMALLGPSGCGKTTLLRTIAGLLRADRGTVRLGSEV